jgi:hypothetical protein
MNRPSTMPCAPPSISPNIRNSALIAPSRIVVFSTFDISLFYALHQSGHERGPVGQGTNLDVFM